LRIQVFGTIDVAPSWPGFVPAIHVFLQIEKQDVDARDKRGHGG